MIQMEVGKCVMVDEQVEKRKEKKDGKKRMAIEMEVAFPTTQFSLGAACALHTPRIQLYSMTPMM